VIVAATTQPGSLSASTDVTVVDAPFSHAPGHAPRYRNVLAQSSRHPEAASFPAASSASPPAWFAETQPTACPAAGSTAWFALASAIDRELDAAPFKRKRARMSEEIRASLNLHSLFREYKQDRTCEWLADITPEAVVDMILGGELARQQIPDPVERRAALISTVRMKAGSDGAALGKARRALNALYDFRPGGCLPVSPLLIHSAPPFKHPGH
jgi:hypothetical protein